MASSPLENRASPPKRRRLRTLFYSIDVLTDGSEWTGNGTLFVSVYKEAPYANEYWKEAAGSSSVIDDSQAERSDRWPQVTPLARYAFGSLSDLTSRLAFDQRYSLATTKAFFQLQQQQNNDSNTPQCQGLEGLPALLLNLQQAGAEQVTLCLDSKEGPDNNNNNNMMQAIQDTIELIVPSHRSQHPRVQLCCVPRSLPTDTDPSCWWMVYRDDYIVVHSKRVQQGALPPDSPAAVLPQQSIPTDSVVYLVTLLCHERPFSSLAVVSGTLHPTRLEDALRQLPVMTDTGNQDAPDIPVASWGLSVGSALTLSPATGARDMTWFYTSPCPEGVLDGGLLVRAQQQSTAWHAGKPQWFPWNKAETNDDDAAQQVSNDWTHLRTGCSVVLNHSLRESRRVVDRMRQLKQYVPDDAATISTSSRSSLPMQCDFGMPSTVDENEIDLDDEEEQIDDPETAASSNQASTTRLLVLGTGCAAPSPYRGSSGYALLLRDDFTFVFEVGDGFLTQWSRYSSRSLLSIRVIWISHAHWDHYGGLAVLLSKLAELRQKRNAEVGVAFVPAEQNRERLETGGFVDVPLVLASGKILKYLDRFFGETSNYFMGANIGRQARHASEMICRLTARSNNGETFPVTFFDIVRVDHCADSFGFVIGLNQRQQQAPFVFCFSGDTRPCSRLVSSCQLCGEQWSMGVVDVLLHEATFDQAEASMSIAKKHSTVKEAIDIGQSMRALRILLTHFSQRYSSPPDHDNIASGTSTPMFDGVLVPLFIE